VTEKGKRGRPRKVEPAPEPEPAPESITAEQFALTFCDDGEETPDYANDFEPERTLNLFHARIVVELVPAIGALTKGQREEFYQLLERTRTEALERGGSALDVLQAVIEHAAVIIDFEDSDPPNKPGQRGPGKEPAAWVEAIADLVRAGTPLDEAMRCAEQFWRVLKEKNVRLSEVRSKQLPPSFRILNIYGNGDWLTKFKKIEERVRENIDSGVLFTR
jgi:hypothetical protein